MRTGSTFPEVKPKQMGLVGSYGSGSTIDRKIESLLWGAIRTGPDLMSDVGGKAEVSRTRRHFRV
jgi:cbb3-type cytochrome oxidase cytochrome c subunit